jgi:hypothetical protein
MAGENNSTNLEEKTKEDKKNYAGRYCSYRTQFDDNSATCSAETTDVVYGQMWKSDKCTFIGQDYRACNNHKKAEEFKALPIEDMGKECDWCHNTKGKLVAHHDNWLTYRCECGQLINVDGT